MEDPLVNCVNDRALFQKSVVAVSGKSCQIQKYGEEKDGLCRQVRKSCPYKGEAQQQGRQIPEMVKGSVGQDHFQEPSQARAIEMTCVQVDGQIQEHRRQIDKPDTSQVAQAPAGISEGFGQHEEAGYHKEKGNGRAGNDPGQHEIRLRTYRSQRRGVNHDDKQCGQKLEAVDAGIDMFLCHRFLGHGYLQSVTTQPSVFVPDTWKGRVDGSDRSTEPSEASAFW